MKNLKALCLTFIVLLGIIVALHGVGFAEKNEMREFINAVDLYKNGKFEDAFKIAHRYYKKQYSHKGMWAVFISDIYLKNGQYDKALDIIDPIKIEISSAYKNKRQYFFEGSAEANRSLLCFLYRKLIAISSVSNFKTKNWKRAIIDYKELESEFGESNKGLMGICFYKLGNYSEAIDCFKADFEAAVDSDRQSVAAYNVAALYSLLNDVGNSIQWLKIPFGENKHRWLAKVKKDKDFDQIRSNKRFKEFIGIDN
jgi:tetratricopeptide (TPR) repeat protein